MTLLRRLTDALAVEGLAIVRPLDQAALDRAEVPLALASLLPGAKAGLVIGDGGPTFFARFRAAGDPASADPLDAYTAVVVRRVLASVLGPEGVAHAALFPFVSRPPFLPFQRLGQAAGLPAPGPLGLQIHPELGPWWAYRAFAVLDCALGTLPPLAPVCPGCAAPCVAACPGEAVSESGFRPGACLERRAIDPACALGCAARTACVAGPAHRYPDEQLRFHMAASLVHVRAHARARGRGL